LRARTRCGGKAVGIARNSLMNTKCNHEDTKPRRITYTGITSCLRVLVVAFMSISCGRAERTSPRARNLVLITIDTLRADHVGAYGYARAHTPALDGLARSGVMFERAYAAAPITLPSHATMLTGRYPSGHGARDNGMRVNGDVPTLATQLKALGFRTAAFVAAFPLDHQ